MHAAAMAPCVQIRTARPMGRAASAVERTASTHAAAALADDVSRASQRASLHLARLAHALQARLRAMELRIDVAPTPVSVEDELRDLQRSFVQRLQAQCVPLHVRLHGLRFWHREADAEHYVYVECTSDSALVGYAVLNRLVDVSRALDPHVRSPHTKIAPAFQGRGIATAIYRWALDSGLCLVSGARQSQGAHALWSSLGRRYHLAYVQLIDKDLRLLGPHAPSALREHLHTRLMLFGVEARA